MEYHLTTPLTREDLAPLRAGDSVKLSGIVYTARDAAHARLISLLQRGETPPFALEGSAVYYVGPTPERPSARQAPPPPGAWTAFPPCSSSGDSWS